MTAHAQPNLDAKVLPTELSDMCAKVAVQICNAKEEWIDKVMKRLLPPDIYSAGYDRRGTAEEMRQRRERVQRWLDSHDYRMEEYGIHARLFHGAKLVSAFTVKLPQ